MGTQKNILYSNTNDIQNLLTKEINEKDLKVLTEKKEEIYNILNSLALIKDNEFNLQVAKLRIAFDEKITMLNTQQM